VTERRVFESVRATTVLFYEMRKMNPAQFTWRPPPYEYEHEKLPIDILAGTSRYRNAIEQGVDPKAIADGWRPGVSEFERLRAEFRLY
jgi:uncharacterized protein YbbC (DUF1343 family)